MNKKRFLVCPKCGDRRFRIKNKANETIVVNVTYDKEISPITENEIVENYNLEELFCLGCSWSGSKNMLLKYLIIK